MSESNTTVNAEVIPEIVRERERWLLWDSSADTPRRPHWDGDFGISWSDPDDWHRFEEAVELAEEVESYGIGYVIQPEDSIYIIDIDTPFDSEREPHEWFPGLDFFEASGCYMEWSPSGNGIHIPVRGSPPDWWRDCEADPEGHQGVECLTNKFCSFTGDTIQDGQILRLGPKPWLKEVYQNIKGEEPDIGQQSSYGSSGSKSDLSREDVEELLDHCDNMMHYDDWVSVGYAVHAWDDGPKGRQLFESWSQKSQKFDEEGQRVIDWIWSNAKPDGKIGPGTLVYHAKEGGWTPPEGKSPDEAAEDLENILERYEADDESPSKKARYQIGDLLADVDESAFEDLTDRAAEVLETTTESLERHRELEWHRRENGPVLVEEGRTWYLSGAPLRKYELLNFEFDVNSFLKVPGEPLRSKLEIMTADGETFTKTIEPKIFSQRHRFDDEVLAERFGMTFDSGPRNDDDALDDINRYISKQDAPTLRGTHQIGLHGSEFVWPRGTLAPGGWTDQPETVHVNRDVAFERAVSIPTDRDEYDPEDVKKILTALPKTRDISRFLPVLTWFYAAPMRPLIFEEWNASAFNHLSVTGDTGSGKTTTLRYLWRCFGIDSDPFDVTDTHFAIVTALSASNGVPVWYDEYKPGDIPDWQLNRFHDNYRKAATGATVTRGNQDQTTTEYHLNAPIVVSGEEQIRPPAERRRSIMVTFRDDVTDRGRDTRTAFKELVGSGRVEEGELKLPEGAPDPSDHALAYYRWVAGTDPGDLRAKWQDAREMVWRRWQSWDMDIDLDDMEIQGLQTVAFGWMSMRAFAREHDVPLDALPQEEELDAALRHVAGEIGPDGKRKSHIDRFIELVERAAVVDYLDEGTHYVFVHEGEPGDEELRVKLSSTFDAVSKYVRDHDLGSEDLLSNPSDYRARFKEAANTEGGYVTAWDQYTPPLNRCIGINTVAAMRDLEFDRASFGLAPFERESSDGESSNDDGDGSGGAARAEENGQGELEGARGKVEQHVRAGFTSGDSVDASAVAGKLNLAPGAVEHQLERLAKRKGLLEARESGYVKV